MDISFIQPIQTPFKYCHYQIKELQYELKDTNEEKSELERIIAQKTLELDQRDLLMREHSQILRARDELIPMVQSKQRREKEYVEKLSAIIIEQQKTYFNQVRSPYSLQKTAVPML